MGPVPPTNRRRERLPSISVVIPTFNRAGVVEMTLDHLLTQDYPLDRVEVLVCDNSTDETPAMVRRVATGAEADIRLLRSGHRLPAVKRNEGLRVASGELVLFINDDVWAHPRLLREHARAHAAAVEPIAVLGHISQSQAMPQTPFVAWFEPFAYHEIADRAGQVVPYRYAWSMNLSFPRHEMIGRNLVFHEDWAHIGHEDIELGYRWVAAGRSIVYHPAALAEHYHPHDLASACQVQEAVGAGLRDLEALIDDPHLLERYGVFSWRNRRRAVVRGAARRILFNALTVPPVQRWLERRPRAGTVDRWLYWKVLLHHTNRGYRREPPRHPRPTPTLSPATEVTGIEGVAR